MDRESGGAFLYATVLGLCVGVACGLLFGFGIVVVLCGLLISASLMVCGIRRPKLLLAATVLSAAALGLIRADVVRWQESQTTLAEYFGERVTIEGIVADDPDRRATNTHVVVRAVMMSNGTPLHGTLLAQVSPDVEISYGDEIVVHGILQMPQAFASDGGREFDYPDYLRLSGISAIIPEATIVSAKKGGWSPYGALFSLKHAFEQSLERTFPQPSAALMEGVLLGARSDVPQDIEQMLVAAGLIHIVILAGYALSLVSQGVLDALSFLKPKYRYLLAGAALVLFVLMTGGAATTVRACAMALIAMLARSMHRPSLALRSLAIVGGGMVLWNPLILLYNESFIISVVAVFGLITLAPLCEHWLRFVPEKFDLRSIAASTLSVQIFALPALLYFTGTLSLYALPANLLALPALPWTMLFGFIAGVCGLISPFLSIIPTLIANVFLHYMLFIAQIASSLPFAGAIIPAFPLWLAIAIYIPLFYFAVRLYRTDY